MFRKAKPSGRKILGAAFGGMIVSPNSNTTKHPFEGRATIKESQIWEKGMPTLRQANKTSTPQ